MNEDAFMIQFPNYNIGVTPKTLPKNETLLDKFHSKAKNSADMNDTILVPRTIFKGYLGIMTGTALGTLGMLLQKNKTVSKILSIAGLALSTYGTWSFVRPYIIKDAKGVSTKKA